MSIQDFVPRRSVLYMPGSNARAMEKARSLPADSLILDLEDAVAPSEKDKAREQVFAAVKEGGYGDREIAVRINPLETQWGEQDLKAVAESNIHAVVLSKVESAKQVQDVAYVLNDKPDIAIWAMIETPMGVINVEQIASSNERLNVLVMGTSDLSKDLRVPHTDNRIGFQYVLSKCVLAARAFGLDIIDGVFLDLEHDKGLITACEQGRDLGFDGKSLIHPKQIQISNRIFSPSRGAIDNAHQIIEAWEQSEKAGSGVVVVNGKLVENLHVEEARRILKVSEVIAKRS